MASHRGLSMSNDSVMFLLLWVYEVFLFPVKTDQSVGVIFRNVILANPPHSEQYQSKIMRQPHSDCAAAQSCYLRRISGRWVFLLGRMSHKSYSKALNVMSFVTQWANRNRKEASFFYDHGQPIVQTNGLPFKIRAFRRETSASPIDEDDISFN